MHKTATDIQVLSIHLHLHAVTNLLDCGWAMAEAQPPMVLLTVEEVELRVPAMVVGYLAMLVLWRVAAAARPRHVLR